MKEIMNFNIIIVGGNHHNGLGLARIFGINGYKVIVVVVDKCKKSFLRHSKYVDKCICHRDENAALDYVLSKYKCNNTIIIPYSDGVAYALDKRLDEFSGYIVPSINNQIGHIAKMMVKSEQVEFAKTNGIKMAKSKEIVFNSNDCLWEENIYPCILKPVISAEGNKKDISICNNKEDLNNAMKKYIEKGYKRALLQEYLNIDYEIDVFGCILNNAPYIYLVPTKTIRSWPIEGGTNSFSQIITDKKIVNECYSIIDKLRKSGFRGLYDIELFVINGEIYLNEINYRNSGDVYMAIKQKFYYPLYWVNDCLNIKNNEFKHPMKNTYAMTECADFRYVLKRRIKFREWRRDYKKCDDYALKFKGDMLPAYSRYLSYIAKFLRFKKY